MSRIDDEHRMARYRKDPHEEDLLQRLNQMLAPLEQEQSAAFAAPRLPVLFLVGPPRSGSTLLTQVLAASGGFGYVSNFLAQFWCAPMVGGRIERALRVRESEAEMKFSSVFGVSEGWSGPHEFGYFWGRWFRWRETHKLPDQDLAKIDQSSLRREVAAIESLRGKPVFFKCMPLGLHIPFLSRVFPTSIFVVCEREHVFNAQSLLLSRQERLGSKEHWYSLRPSEYRELLSLAPHEQVASQVGCILEDISRGLQELPEGRSLTVHYEALCDDPKRELGRVIDHLEDLGCSVTRNMDRIPERFPTGNRQRLDDREFALVAEACREFSPRTRI